MTEAMNIGEIPRWELTKEGKQMKFGLMEGVKQKLFGRLAATPGIIDHILSNRTDSTAENLETVATRYFADLEDKARNSVLVQRLSREGLIKNESHKTVTRITTAWQAQAERLLSMWAITQQETKLSSNLMKAMNATGMQSDIPARMALVMQMEGAQVYLIRQDIVSLLNKMPLPRHVIGRDILPYPSMYVTTENAMDVAMSPDAAPSDCDWLLLQEGVTPDGEAAGIRIKLAASDRNPTGAVHPSQSIEYAQLEYGKVWPDDFEDAGNYKFLLAMLAFLNSPFVVSEPTKLPRSTRRELERTGGDNPDALTSVVTLRRSSHNGNSSESGEPTDRDHRWWVSGHIRAQWYPSIKAHKLIWIAPHVKGPEDKPMRGKTYVASR